MSRAKVREQDPKKRINNFNEVSLGFTDEEAKAEAARCLQCKKPLCVNGCPVAVEIPAFIQLIKEGKPQEAARKIRETNMLPAVCGRVCPQETQCEQVCILGKKSDPIDIGKLERFAADKELAAGEKTKKAARTKSRKVSIIGAGPSGLTAAADLARLGYEVVVYESLHKAGGVLTYGIPEFRLPKEIVDREVKKVEDLGVKIRLNYVVGKIKTIDELLDGEADAVYIAVGAGLPVFMGIGGENLNGVYSANEYLTRVNLMKAYLFPEYDTPVKKGKKVAVIGGGNVALDSARTARRMGAEKVYLIYRRSEKEMPARVEEIAHAKEEGIEFVLLTLPCEILGENGFVSGIRCHKMELGEPDESGRCRPQKIEGSEHEYEIDQVIVAVGTRSNHLSLEGASGLRVNDWGYVKTNEIGRTSKKGVFAGGDIVTGSATVISAMGAGRIAAKAINDYLSGSR